VKKDNQLVDLTSAEYRLLLLLANQPDRVFSRDDIMLELNGIDADIYSRAIDILISRLRQKLKPLDVIKTIRSQGYQFVLQSRV
jgi:OmpR family response regulator RpaB